METKQIDGFSICGYADDPYFTHLEANYGATSFYRTVLERLIKPDATIIDVGANIGMTAMMARSAIRHCRVLAVEPSPRAYAALNATVRENGANAEIQTLNIAASDQNGSMPFAEAQFLAGSHLSNISTGDTVLVETRRLDDIVADFGPAKIDLIKIDVEGFELEVLKGMADTQRRFRPLVYLEFNSFTIAAYGCGSPRSLLEYSLKNFDGVAYLGADREFQPLTDWLGFLHTNMIQHGCVDDILLNYHA